MFKETFLWFSGYDNYVIIAEMPNAHLFCEKFQNVFFDCYTKNAFGILKGNVSEIISNLKGGSQKCLKNQING
jgi:hypothetical protein